MSIFGWRIVFSVGVVIQFSASYSWAQIVVGGFVAGLGAGAFSIPVPLFQSETAPSYIRGAILW